VQFHWWDYGVAGYVDAAVELARLKDKGKIAHIGATNFDVPHLREILNAGVPIISLQAQYSLLDQRPRNGMIDLCRRHDIALLCYGTVAGGFLSERWVARGEPGELSNRSLIKYKLIIDDFGGWTLFQHLLLTLERIAVKHRCDIATVAARAVLDRDRVAAVIIGRPILRTSALTRKSPVWNWTRAIPRPFNHCLRAAGGRRATYTSSSAIARAVTAGS